MWGEEGGGGERRMTGLEIGGKNTFFFPQPPQNEETGGDKIKIGLKYETGKELQFFKIFKKRFLYNKWEYVYIKYKSK